MFVGIVESRAKRILTYKKNDADRRGVPFSLSMDWVIKELERNTCAVTGIKFQWTKNGHRMNPFSPQIDRIYPKKGYTDDNSQMVCSVYNMAKMDWGHDAVVIMARALLNNIELNPVVTNNAESYKDVMATHGATYIAKYFDVSRPTVYDWAKRGSIPGKYARTAERFASDYGIDKAQLCPEAY